MPTDAPFVKRCQSAGISIMTLDAEGRVLGAHPRLGGAIDAVVIGSQQFTGALRRLALRWVSETDPEPSEVFKGCRVVPIPVFRRRQLTGFFLAVLITQEISDSSPFASLCATSCLSEQEARQRVLEHSPRESEAHRWAAFLRWMHEDLVTLERHSGEIDDLTKQLGGVYEELSLVYKLSARMSVTHEPSRWRSCARRWRSCAR